MSSSEDEYSCSLPRCVSGFGLGGGFVQKDSSLRKVHARLLLANWKTESSLPIGRDRINVKERMRTITPMMLPRMAATTKYGSFLIDNTARATMAVAVSEAGSGGIESAENLQLGTPKNC